MSKVAVGSIPEKITYVYAGQQEVAVGCEWDIEWNHKGYDSKVAMQKVTPAFPVDSADKKTMERAISWAKRGRWDQATNEMIFDPYYSKEVDNLSITNVKVLSLQHRGQGGRAYKALIDNFYVDLREDVLMDTLLQSGVDAGGILKGEYVWAKLGSQTKLVRVGSELYRLITEFDSKKDIKPVGKKDLEVGGIYQDRKKQQAIFIGYVNTTRFTLTNQVPSWQRENEKATFDFKQTTVKKSLLFYDLHDYEELKDTLTNIKNGQRTYRFKIKKSHTYIEKIDQVVLPDDIISHLRNLAVSDIKGQVLEYLGRRDPKPHMQRTRGPYLEEAIARDSDHLNLYEYGKEEVKPFDIKTLLLFS